MSEVSETLSRVTVVSVDAMYTIFQPHINGRLVSRIEIEGRVYRCVADIKPWQLSNAVIHEIVEEERLTLEPMKDDDRFWRMLNTEVFRRLLDMINANKVRRNLAMHYAEKAHDKFLGSTEFWMIQPSMLDFLTQMKERGIRVIIASNHRSEPLGNLLSKNDRILDLIDEVYTSEALGVSKAFPEFWEQIAVAEREVDPYFDTSTMLHVGNSYRSDIGACRAGIPLLVYDREKVLGRIPKLDLARFAEIVRQRPVLAPNELLLPFPRSELTLSKDMIDDASPIIQLSSEQRQILVEAIEAGRISVCNTVTELRQQILPLAA